MEKINLEKNTKVGCLLSFPRSGNHLVRFFIEYLQERPTYGAINENLITNTLDIPVYLNKYKNKINFNITENNKKNYIAYKSHSKILDYFNNNFLIFILRDPRECLVKHSGYNIKKINFDFYFNLIDQYNNFKGKKILFYYEDILQDKKKFINNLSKFLLINNDLKINDCLENIDYLFNNSLNPMGRRAWGGNNSNSNIKYHFNKLSENNKNDLMKNLRKYINQEKYHIFMKKYFN